MDHRSPLRDLTAFTIENMENLTKMEKINEVLARKPRQSVIKAFDPLYDSPKLKVQDFEISSDNSFSFESTSNSNQNDENMDPLFSTLVNISNSRDDVFVDDIKSFIENIIDEALNNIFSNESNCCNNLSENTLEIRSELVELKLKVKKLTEENQIIQTELDQHISSTEQLKRLVKNKDEDLYKVQEELLEIRSQNEELKLRIIKYENAKNRAEDEVIQYKEKLKLSLEKNAENINLEESNVIKELQNCLSNKNEEIRMANEKLLQQESAYVLTELKLKEHEDLLEQYNGLFEKHSSEIDTLKEENSWLKKHLSSQEMAFGDVYHKYERCKKVIEGYKTNEEALKKTCAMFESSLNNYEDSRQAQQEEADAKYAKWEMEFTKAKNEYKTETSKLFKKMKHLEIKNASLTSSLEQKTLECQELTDLCQEITERS